MDEGLPLDEEDGLAYDGFEVGTPTPHKPFKSTTISHAAAVKLWDAERPDSIRNLVRLHALWCLFATLSTQFWCV